jgi:hypothetical protein
LGFLDSTGPELMRQANDSSSRKVKDDLTANAALARAGSLA